MVFRNDFGPVNRKEFAERHFEGTNLGLAFSPDGIHWAASVWPCYPGPQM